jgi:predicted metal-dependent hydrolase
MVKQAQVTHLQVEGIPIELRRKNIRSFRISVHPPKGEVKVSAPFWMSEARILEAVLERHDWMVQARKRWEGVRFLPVIQIQEGETLTYRNETLTLRVFEGNSTRSTVHQVGKELHLRVSSNSSQLARQKVLDRWYRDQLLSLLPEVMDPWKQKLGVEVGAVQIKKMKSRWGSCHPKSKKITLNLELMRCDPKALEYVVLHELAHLIEPSHNARFKAILDEQLPEWRDIQKSLPLHLY